MLRKNLPPAVLLFGTFYLFISCSIENEAELTPQENVSSIDSVFVLSRRAAEESKTISTSFASYENLQEQLILSFTGAEECSSTKFSEVNGKHFYELTTDSVAMANLDRYLNLNRYASQISQEQQYFGNKGEYTPLVNKLTRDLERFWNMPNEISVLGQHTRTLDDRDKLVELIWLLLADLESKEDVYPIVDEMLYYNSLSPLLPESPIFASDGLSSYNDKIIIGDGLVDLFMETGVAAEIVWSTILSHEWSHQIQMNHATSWYPDGSFSSKAERTRLMELEADFFSAYYMTHKRGATFNWKKVQEALNLFFESGDCGFDFPSHHGTPMQRERAAQQGHLIAAQAQRKGQILKPVEIHQLFLEQLPQICEPCLTKL